MALLQQPISTDLQPEQIRPVASPTDAYVRPAQPTPDKGLDFLNALGKLSPAVADLGAQLVRPPSQDEQRAQDALVAVKYGDKTSDQLAKEIEANPNNHPVFRAAMDRLRGAKLGIEGEQYFKDQLATGDPASMDPEQLVQGYMDKVRPLIGDNKFAAMGFAEKAGGLPDQVRALISEARNKKALDVRDDTLFAVMQDTVQKNANDPAKVTESIADFTHKNAQFLGMPRQEQEKLLDKLTDSLSNQPDMEKAIGAIGALPSSTEGVSIAQSLGPKWDVYAKRAEATTISNDRKHMQDSIAGFQEDAAVGQLDEKGYRQWADPFVKKGALGGKAYESLIRTNQRAISQQHKAAEKDILDNARDKIAQNLLPGDVEAVLNGRAADIDDNQEDVLDHTFKVSAKDRTDAALKSASDAIASNIQRAQDVPDAQKPQLIRERQVALYGRNGQMDPQLQRSLTQLANTSAPDADTVKAVATYLPELAVAQKVAPKQVYDIFKGKPDRAFVDALVVGHEAGLGAQAAINEAVRRRDLAAAGELPTLSQADRGQVVTDVMKKLNDNGLLHFNNNPRNTQVLQAMISRHADYWYGVGTKSDDLATNVANTLKQNLAFVGGSYVDTQHLRVPAMEAQAVFDEAAKALKEADPRYAKGDVTFIPVRPGSTAYRAISIAPSGMATPIAGSDMEFDQMSQMQKQRMIGVANQKQDDAAVKAAGKAAADEIMHPGQKARDAKKAADDKAAEDALVESRKADVRAAEGRRKAFTDAVEAVHPTPAPEAERLPTPGRFRPGVAGQTRKGK